MTIKMRHPIAIALGIALTIPVSSSAMETIFYQDFESGLGPNQAIVLDPGEASPNPRMVSCSMTDCPFSASRVGNEVRNFEVHDRHTNPYAGGDGGAGNDMKHNPRMSGQVLGHVFADYDRYEDVYYQVDNISLSADLTDLQLMFDFDSWIQDDGGDGFAVAINDGSGWDLLNPNASSEMQYSEIGTVGDASLNRLTGQDTSSGSPIVGFSGWENGNPIDMAGTAMFDIADTYAGDTVSLRFAFASDKQGEQEGINIDNIKLTGVCVNGSGPDCAPPPSNNVPLPGPLALAVLGLAFVSRSRRNAKR